MFNDNIGSRLTIMKSMVESADSGLELTNSPFDSNTDPAKVGMLVRAFSFKTSLP